MPRGITRARGAALLAAIVVVLAGCGSPTDDLTLPMLEPAAPTSLVPTATVEFMGVITGESAPLRQPIGVAVDSQSNIYIVESGTFGVRKFDWQGQFVTQWDRCPKDQMTAPVGVAADSQGNVYVSDAGRDRICKFDSNGKLLATWGSGGTGNGQFDGPFDLVVDSKNTVYVIDYNHNRIEIFHQPL